MRTLQPFGFPTLAAWATLVVIAQMTAAEAPGQGRRGRGAPAAPETTTVTTPSGARLRVETVVDSLNTVWDMKWAPDGELWFTERSGRVSRLDVATGKVTRVGAVPGVTQRSESGLMGLAFHPDFPREPWIYFVHSFGGAGGRAGARGGGARAAIRNRLVRMRYEEGKLAGVETLIDSIPGASNHDGAALVIGPDRMLYMSMGDATRRELAQDSSSLNGKVLRLTLDGRSAPGNPFGNAIWSWGHRNSQGLAFHPTTGALFSSEHGEDAEDEVNRIDRGRNYGWPAVEGMCNQAEEEEFCRTAIVVQPVWVAAPTVGLSGLDIYESETIPGWKGSLLLASLAGRSLYRLTLSGDKRTVTSSERLFEGEFGRLRDVLVASDGSVYIATSNRDGRGRPVRADDRIIRLRRF
jgi:glucose/arabinose dehydrogenase